MSQLLDTIQDVLDSADECVTSEELIDLEYKLCGARENISQMEHILWGSPQARCSITDALFEDLAEADYTIKQALKRMEVLIEEQKEQERNDALYGTREQQQRADYYAGCL